jgi:hypothetical protein
MASQSSPDHGAKIYDGSSIVAFALGLASLGSFALSPMVAGLVGALAVVAATVSRRRLRRDGSLRGSRLSLGGFVLGVIALAIAVGPPLISLAITSIGSL